MAAITEMDGQPLGQEETGMNTNSTIQPFK